MDYFNNNGDMNNIRRCDGIIHTIKEGDTLYNIGRKHNVPVADLIEANPFINVYNLRIGMQICVPTTEPMMDFENMYNDYPMNNNTMRDMMPPMNNNTMRDMMPPMNNNTMRDMMPPMNNNTMRDMMPPMNNNTMRDMTPQMNDNMMRDLFPPMNNNMMREPSTDNTNNVNQQRFEYDDENYDDNSIYDNSSVYNNLMKYDY